MVEHTYQDNQLKKDDTYCYIFVRSDVSMGIAVSLILANCFILIYSYYGYKKIAQNVLRITLTVKVIIILIFIEGIQFIVQYILAIIYYYTLLQQNKSNLKGASIANYTLQNIGGFLVQFLFLLVIFNLTKNILDYCANVGIIFPKKIQYLYNCLKIYILIRFMRLIPIIMMAFDSYQDIQCMSKFSFGLNMIDALISFVIMLLCYIMIIQPYALSSNRMSSSQIKKLKKQLIRLLIVAFYRFLSVLVNYIIIVQNNDELCPNKCPQQSIINILIVLIFGQPFLKLLPIIFMIRLQLPLKQTDQEISSRKSSLQQIFQQYQ